jgi:hypothetical protein
VRADTPPPPPIRDGRAPIRPFSSTDYIEYA